MPDQCSTEYNRGIETQAWISYKLGHQVTILKDSLPHEDAQVHRPGYEEVGGQSGKVQYLQKQRT